MWPLFTKVYDEHIRMFRMISISERSVLGTHVGSVPSYVPYAHHFIRSICSAQARPLNDVPWTFGHGSGLQSRLAVCQNVRYARLRSSNLSLTRNEWI